MKILRNYILKDFISAFLFSIFALTLVMMLGNLTKISEMIIRKGVNVIDAFKIFSFFIPYTLGFTIPISLLTAVLLTMGRLISDNEIVAIQVAGVSILRILSIFVTIGIIFCLFLFLLNDKILPTLHYNYRSRLKNLYTKNINALIEPGVYLENFKDSIIYIDDVKENKLKNIFIYQITNGKLTGTTFAKSGEFVVDDNTLKMKLENGFRDEIDPEKAGVVYRLKFKVVFEDFPIKSVSRKKVEKKPSDMTIKELKTMIKKLKEMNVSPRQMVTELYKRISFSFSPLTFVILGFGVSLVVKHREKSINFGIAFLIAGVYYLLLLLGETLTRFNFTPPLLGMWLPNIAIGLVGIYLIVKNAYIR